MADDFISMGFKYFLLFIAIISPIASIWWSKKRADAQKAAIEAEKANIENLKAIVSKKDATIQTLTEKLEFLKDVRLLEKHVAPLIHIAREAELQENSEEIQEEAESLEQKMNRLFEEEDRDLITSSISDVIVSSRVLSSSIGKPIDERFEELSSYLSDTYQE